MSTGHPPIIVIRVGIFMIGAAFLVFLLAPQAIVSISTLLPIHSATIDYLKQYPGFGIDWEAIVSLAIVLICVYCYLLIVIAAGSLLHPAKANTSNSNYWHRYSPLVRRTSTRARIQTMLFDVLCLLAASYIGYTALQSPPTNGTFFHRLIDGLLVNLWCHSIFSILSQVIPRITKY
jgi:hypothetical protein